MLGNTSLRKVRLNVLNIAYQNTNEENATSTNTFIAALDLRPIAADHINTDLVETKV